MKRQTLSSAGERNRIRGAAYGIAAAILFGLSAPVSKLLLPAIHPLMLASLLYLGAGLGLTLFGVRKRTAEAPLRRTDLPTIAGIILTGGILGPVLMLYGLTSVSGLTGSLLLNMEAPFTMLIAVMIFREHLSRREVVASAVIVTAALVLSYEPGQLGGSAIGAVAIAAACASWGIDNNLTQRLSLKDPVALVRIKTLGAGVCTLFLAFLFGQALPPLRLIIAAAILGVFSYGISILLDAYALRILGAAREAAFFATAPFIGAIISIPLLGDQMSVRKGIGFAFMLIGVAALVRARHGHHHTHESLEHEHLHSHDEHHRHNHLTADPPGEPHSHPHRHEPLTHEHAHVSDLHHRHRH